MRNLFATVILSLALYEASPSFVDDGIELALGPQSVATLQDGLSLALAAENIAIRQGGRLMAAAPPKGNLLDRKNWAVTCDSFQPGNECIKAIDGDKNTFWHTTWGQINSPLPHTITIDMKTMQNIRGVTVLPRQDKFTGGYIAQHQIFLSKDGKRFRPLVAYGTWYADNTQKVADFEPERAQFVRIVALSEASGNPWTSIAEINVYGAPNARGRPKGVGAWGPTINFPVIPVAASLMPNGNVLVWSSWDNDEFIHSPNTFTMTAIFDHKTHTVSQRNVTNTHHDMFCPGISIDANGRIVVTGGNAARRTSIYDPASDGWISAPDMVLPRGYQSSATCADGRVFTIGGSFTGGLGGKNGEIYDPKLNKWELLPQCPVAPMLTADARGFYRSDNHALLFSWKDNTVFQAGPSKAMNWYTMTGAGGVKGAGFRGDDGDAMCSVAVMYDAAAGKILTAGGAQNYENIPATTNGFIVTIGAPNQNPEVKRTGNNMNFNRIYHNAVILPNGETFIVGGQAVGEPFRETRPRFTPEMYNPDTNQFRTLVPNAIPRVYHAFALLLQDGTVLSGGGGLCGNCDTNHFDAQVYTPPYLFNAAGHRAKRPKIVSISTSMIKIKERLTITTDDAVTDASMIRLGSATHSINTDQRRVVLSLTAAEKNTYTVEMPGDYGILLPGYWWMFVLNADGVPSVGKTVKVVLP